MPQTKTLGPKFEYRHYEAVRRDALAPVIGKLGIEGAQVAELQGLKKRRKTEVRGLVKE